MKIHDARTTRPTQPAVARSDSTRAGARLLHIDRLVWYGCFQDDTGENWWFLNNHVRMCISMSDGQFKTSPIKVSGEMEEFLTPHRKRYPE
jgi:hypothetical protein